MSSVSDALERFRESPPGDGDVGLRLRSVVFPPAEQDEVQSAWQDPDLPTDAKELWRVCRSARLFEDVDYGQWGLILLDPAASARRTARERADRPADLRPDDVVIGEFLGDQELVVVAPSEEGRRRVLIALPLDRREDWFGAAEGLAELLERFLEAGGMKYWEGR